jgi:hypothetical protein
MKGMASDFLKEMGIDQPSLEELEKHVNDSLVAALTKGKAQYEKLKADNKRLFQKYQEAISYRRAMLDNRAGDPINELFEFLKHGDEKHQAWLKEALDAFFEGKERPEEKKYHDPIEPHNPFIGMTTTAAGFPTLRGL